MLRSIRSIFIVLLMTLALTGCTSARTRALEEYKVNMTRFYDNITAYDQRINAIDASSDTAVEDLLTYLDGLKEEFSALRTYDVPQEFSSISDLTIDAADSMEQAVALYHEAYDGEFDAVKAADASVLYQRANRCVQIILQVLHGEEPTGDDIRVTY